MSGTSHFSPHWLNVISWFLPTANWSLVPLWQASLVQDLHAGTLVQLIFGPFALLVDAISFVVSAASIAGIRVQTVHPATLTTTHKLLSEISEGLRFVWQHPIIRALTLCATLFNLFDSMMGAEYILYLSQKLHMVADCLVLLSHNRLPNVSAWKRRSVSASCSRV